MKNSGIKWKSVELKKITINNITRNDMNFLIECHNDLKSRYLYSGNMIVQSEEDYIKEFQKKLNFKYHEFMVVKNVNSNGYIGFIYSFRYNANDGTVYTTICMIPQYRNSVYGVEAGMAFYEYLFNKYSIRKIYCCVYDYNKMSMSFLKKAGFQIEGILKENKFFNGNYANLYILSLYKEDFNKLKEKLKNNKNEQ